MFGGSLYPPLFAPMKGSASHPFHRARCTTQVIKKSKIYGVTSWLIGSPAGGIWKYWVFKMDDNVSFETQGGNGGIAPPPPRIQ